MNEQEMIEFAKEQLNIFAKDCHMGIFLQSVISTIEKYKEQEFDEELFETPMHFTTEQKAWIKQFVNLRCEMAEKRKEKELKQEFNKQELKWIPVKYHYITNEEREENCISDDICYWLDCAMPDDEEKILIVRKWNGGYITEYDTCFVDDGYCLYSGLDWREVVAWMPIPEYHFLDETKKVGGAE